jgi:hypothetical protein
MTARRTASVALAAATLAFCPACGGDDDGADVRDLGGTTTGSTASGTGSGSGTGTGSGTETGTTTTE